VEGEPVFLCRGYVQIPRHQFIPQPGDSAAYLQAFVIILQTPPYANAILPSSHVKERQNPYRNIMQRVRRGILISRVSSVVWDGDS